MQSRKRTPSRPLTLNSIDSKNRKLKSSDIGSIFPRILRSNNKLIYDLQSDSESDGNQLLDSDYEVIEFNPKNHRKDEKVIKNLENLSIDSKNRNISGICKNLAKSEFDINKSNISDNKSKSKSKKFFHKFNKKGKKLF